MGLLVISLRMGLSQCHYYRAGGDRQHEMMTRVSSGLCYGILMRSSQEQVHASKFGERNDNQSGLGTKSSV